MHGATARTLTVLVLVGLVLAGGFLPLRASSDPTIIDNPDGTSDAVWDFATPGDYARSGTSISGGVVSLERPPTWWNRTSAADFGAASSTTNVDLTSWPGNVAIWNESGPSTPLTIQPGAVGEDAYLDRQFASTNRGADTTMLLDGRNPDAYRPILRFDLSSIPASAVIDRATFSLYMSSGLGNPLTVSVHRVTATWNEAQVTWNDRLTGTAWGTAGGDYAGYVIAQATIDNTAGWKSWNVTQLVDLWYRGRVPNQGLLVVPPGGGSDSDKTFFSSDYNVDPTRRPKLDLTYRILGGTGELVSEVGGPATLTNWQTISWNATERSLVSDEFPGPGLDAKWTWTNAPPTWDVGTTVPGSLHLVSATGVELDGATFTGHVLANEVVGDFTATMKFSSNPTANGQKAGLLVWLNNRNWYAVQKTYVVATATADWQAKSTVDAASAIRASANSGNPIPGWVRIARSGNTFTASTSSDGVAWSTLDTYAPGTEYPLQVRLALFAADGNSGTAHTVDVDYVRASLGPDATVAVQTRTGNTTPVDGTWSGWSAPYATPSGSAMAGTARYIQYRLTFAVTYPDHTPNVGDVNLSWGHYATPGTIETNDLVPGDVEEWGNLTVAHALNGQSIAYAYSTDGGGAWTPVVPPASLASVSTASGRIRFRATLSTTDTLVTPTVSEIRLTYRHQLDHFFVSASGPAAAGAAFGVTVTAKDSANVTLTGWTGTVTLAARLADGVTPGGGTLGTTSLAITTGGTATLATETYTKAETIRIRASFGGAAGLSGNVAISPGPVTRVDISPANVTLLLLDTQAFTAQGFDAWDNAIPGLAYSWITTGGVGTLNSSSGSTVSFTAGTLEGNGTVEATSGAVTGVALVSVVNGTRPWIAMSSPVAGAHLTGVVTIAYTNSSDAVSVTFAYNGGAGWILIGTTATLTGTYAWDTAGIDFAAGSVRAIVENNRTVTNTTVVSPLDVDNTAPAIALGAVTDEQATTGTLTIAYTTDPDVVRVDLTYFDGAWQAVGTDLTVDGSFVWTPSGPVNGVTIEAVATDEVDLSGSDRKVGVGNRTLGPNPPRVQGIPEIRVRVGSPYALNLTFYVTDADTPLSGLTVTVSDPGNVSATLGAYPSLGFTYGSAGTYLVTVWVSDGTDTGWAVVRVVASNGNPPALAAPLPSLVLDEDTPAPNALGAPLTAHFTDADGEVLTFAVFGAVFLSTLVNPNATLDLNPAANWVGAEVLRVRASDPSGGFAEAAFLVTVLPVNDAPEFAAIAPLNYDAGATVVIDVSPYLYDVDNNVLTELTVTTDSAYVQVSGFLLTLSFPAEWDRTNFTITASDGSAIAAQNVDVTFIPPWWRSPYLLAIPPAAVIAVVAMFAQRARWRPAKAFLVDERGQLLREFTLDPACHVSYDDAVKAGVLDAVEAPIKIAKYTGRTVVGDALGVVLLAYGPVSLDQVEFARELLVNVQGKFEATVLDRLAEARSFEDQLETARKSLDESQAAFETQSREFAEVQATVASAQAQMVAEAESIRVKLTDLESREARVREDRKAIDRLARDVESTRTALDATKAELEGREASVGAREEATQALEARLRPLERELSEREAAVGGRDVVLKRREADVSEKESQVAAATESVQEREAAMAAEREALESRGREIEATEATVRTRTEELQALGTETDRKVESLKVIEARVAPIAASIQERQEAAERREADVKAHEARVAARESEVASRFQALEEAEARLQGDQAKLEERIQEVDGQDSLVRAQFAELKERQAETEARAAHLDERESGIASGERQLAERAASLAPREGALREEADRIAKAQAALEERSRGLDGAQAAQTEQRAAFEKDRAGFDARMKEFESRSSGFEADVRKRTADMEGRSRTLQDREAAHTAASQEFEALRSEKTQWIASKEIELEAREQALGEKEGAVRSQAEENARVLADLSSREETLEIGTDKLEKARADVEARRADLEKLAKALDAKAAQLRGEESRKAEEYRTWHATLESEQALLREQRDAFEKDAGAQRETWADRMLRVQMREQDVGEREAKVRTDVEWIKSSDEEIKKREAAVAETAKQLDAARAELEGIRKDHEARGMELDTRERSLREEASHHAQELTSRARSLQESEKALADARGEFERESTARAHEFQAQDAELAQRAKALDTRASELAAQEVRLASAFKSLKEQEDRLQSERQDLQRTSQQVSARQEETAQLRTRNEDEATRLRKERESFQASVAEKEAELASERERISRDSSNLQEKLGAKAQELAARERDLAAREAELRSEEHDLEARQRELDSNERKLVDQSADVEARAGVLAKRSREVEDRAAKTEAMVKRLAMEDEQKRREWEILQKTLKSQEEQIQADAVTRLSDVSRRLEEVEGRERMLTNAMTQVEAERAKLADAAKAQAAKDAESNATSARAEKRLADAKGMEADILRERQAFESERTAWSARRSEELRQLEATRDAAGEQAAQAERLIQETQRRANVAAEAEKAAKRQAEEARAHHVELEARRTEIEAGQQAVQAQTGHLEEASRKLATREMDQTRKAKDLEDREARIAAASQKAATAADELKARRGALDRDAATLERGKADLEALRASLDARASAIDSKTSEVGQREQVLTTELQRAENLMEDLGRKDAELRARERQIASADADLAARQEALARKDAELKEGTAALERMRQDLEARLEATEQDRKTAASARDEAVALRDEAEKAKAQADAMQKEVSKNMKFLQKKAVDVLDREETLRTKAQKLEDNERALEARAEILDAKTRSLDVDREESETKVGRLESELAKLKGQLSEAKDAAKSAADMDEWKRDMEARVKIIQKKAFDLLDREEKLRKREEDLKARAQELGIEI
jgi:chromosome segregation ATPase/regulation of enolase protein 1 (concanavalin A-like superfamily)